MKTLLLFPPHWRPTQPYLSLPTLASFLRSKGKEVAIMDINALFFEHVLSKSHLKDCLTSLKQRINRLTATPELHSAGVSLCKRLFLIEALATATIDQIEEAMAIMKSSKALNLASFRRSGEIIAAGLDLAAASVEDIVLTFDLFRCRYQPDNPEEVKKAVVDESENFFIPFFKQFSLPAIEMEAPGLVGISINSLSQVIPGLTLARLIKESMPAVHITIGGNQFSYISENIRELWLFSWIDSIVLFEGEETLNNLIDRLENRQPVAGLSNLMVQSGDKIICGKRGGHIDLIAQPAPAFKALLPSSYLSPQVVYPLQYSRGCYWNKCSFCDYTYSSQGYRIKDPQDFAREVAQVTGAQTPGFFHLVDSAPAVGHLLELAEELIKNKTQVFWATMCRFEPLLEKPENVALLYRAGCRIIEFGLESGSDKMLKSMNKGATTSMARKILDNCQAAGIFTVVFVVVGLPEETKSDAEKTIKFLGEMAESIDSVSLSKFVLKQHSPLGQHLEASVLPAVKNEQNWWNSESQLSYTPSMSQDELQTVFGQLRSIEQQKPLAKQLARTLWDVSYLLQWLVANNTVQEGTDNG
ncbi:MAG: radical SAM protein [Pseudomonadota bacterium]